MAETLKKAAVAQFLEAVKSSLNHLSQLKMDLSEAGRKPSDLTEKDVMQLYSRVRRLREVLRRWLSSYPTPETLELPGAELDLLCACLVHELNCSDKRVAAQNMGDGEDAGWLEKRKEILSYWAVEFAQQPIVALPNLWGRVDVNYDVRQVLVAARDKFAPQARTSSGIYRLGEVSANPTVGGGPARAPGSTVADAIGVGALPGGADIDAPALPVEAARIRDYRLRLAMVLDLRAYERAMAAEDYRLAAVLLSMVFEGVLIDHGLSQGPELGLQGSPDRWPLEAITESVFETEMTKRDYAALRALLKSRDILRPALQLEQPMVVNKAMMQNLEKFVFAVAKSVGVAPSAAASRPLGVADAGFDPLRG